MSVLEILTLVVMACLVLAWYLSYTAARLHRLHTRVEGTYAALDAQLVRRAEAALEMANSGILDPAGALILAGAATESIEAGEAAQGDREAIESDLTHALRLTVPLEGLEDHPEGPVAAQLIGRLKDTNHRVAIARRFHNDAVGDVVRLRDQPIVRLFHLAGHTDLPRMVELDDDLPAGR